MGIHHTQARTRNERAVAAGTGPVIVITNW